MARKSSIEPADWKRMRFKKNKVWLALQADGEPVEKDDLVLIKYQLEQDDNKYIAIGNINQSLRQNINDTINKSYN